MWNFNFMELESEKCRQGRPEKINRSNGEGKNTKERTRAASCACYARGINITNEFI